MNLDLFSSIDSGESWTETICPGAVVLRQYVTAQAEGTWADVSQGSLGGKMSWTRN